MQTKRNYSCKQRGILLNTIYLHVKWRLCFFKYLFAWSRIPEKKIRDRCQIVALWKDAEEQLHDAPYFNKKRRRAITWCCLKLLNDVIVFRGLSCYCSALRMLSFVFVFWLLVNTQGQPWARSWFLSHSVSLSTEIISQAS